MYRQFSGRPLNCRWKYTQIGQQERTEMRSQSPLFPPVKTTEMISIGFWNSKIDLDYITESLLVNGEAKTLKIGC
ncbi:hypothetical protein FBQ94_05695 [Candidatus Jettenia sp. AMX1]|nr:hypothetical protein [Candidatus Jettenia sp. AMX1]